MAWRIQRRGVWRLWIVTAAIWTVTWAVVITGHTMRNWSDIDQLAYANCQGQTYDQVWTYDKCIERGGIGQSLYERENTTAFAWWAEALAYSFVAYCILTFLVAGVFYVCRWVVRGFRHEESPPT